MFRVERAGERVAVLTMDDGKVNAIGPVFVRGFPPAWAEATREGRAVVLAGNAKAFSAGLDLKTLPTLERAALVEFARGFMAVFADILAYERPVVAAVEGGAIAGGAVIALCADFRVAGPRARMGLPEVPVGVAFPEPVALLADRLPPPERAPALLQGVVREGEACVATGWAHRASPEPLAEAVRLADELAGHHAAAYASGKRALNADAAARFAAFGKEAERWVDTALTPEAFAAIGAAVARLAKK